MELKKQSLLQLRALSKLNRGVVFHHQIHTVCTKELPLTEADITQLQTFCDLRRDQLNSAIFFGNTTITEATKHKSTINLLKKDK